MRNRKILHPATFFFLLWWLVAILSWMGSVYAWDGVRNIISTEALRWLLRYTEENLMSSPALYLSIIFFMSFGLFLHSGMGGVLLRAFKRGNKLSGKEKKSLIASAFVAMICFALYSVLAWGPWNIVRGVTGRYIDSPLHDGVFFILSLAVGITSITYGYSSDRYRNDTDIVNGMSYLFARFPSYFVSLFFLIQFMIVFSYSGLPVLLGMNGIVLDFFYWMCCIVTLLWAYYKRT